MMANTKKTGFISKATQKQVDEQTTDSVIEGLLNRYNTNISFRGGASLVDHSSGALSTGLFTLDRAIGVWGLPWERIIEIYGPHMSGKTALVLNTIASAQMLYPDTIIAYIDLEHALDLTLVSNTGVDIESKNFLISEPDSAEQGVDFARDVLRQRQRSIVVFDSVTAMIPQEELDKSITDQERVGLHGKLMSRAVKHIVNELPGSNSMAIFVNQIRHKIRTMGFGGTGYVTSGGEALPFYSSLRLSVTKIQQIKQGENVVGHKSQIKIEKNKVGPPFKSVDIDIYYGSGFCSVTDIADIAIQSNIITKSGAWYEVLGNRYQGMFNLIDGLLANEKLYRIIRDAVMKLYGAPKLHEDQYIDTKVLYGNPDDFIKVENPDEYLVSNDEVVDEHIESD